MKALTQKKAILFSLLGILALSSSFTQNTKELAGSITLAYKPIDRDTVMEFDDGQNCAKVLSTTGEAISMKRTNFKVVNEDQNGNEIISTKWIYTAQDVKCDPVNEVSNFKKIVISSSNKETTCRECEQKILLIPVVPKQTVRDLNNLVKELTFESYENQRIAKIQKDVDNCKRKWVRPSESNEKKSKNSSKIRMGSSSRANKGLFKIREKGRVGVSLTKKERLQCKIEKVEEEGSEKDQEKLFMDEIYPELLNTLRSSEVTERNSALELINYSKDYLSTPTIDKLLRGLEYYGNYRNYIQENTTTYFEKLKNIESSSSNDKQKKRDITTAKILLNEAFLGLEVSANRNFRSLQASSGNLSNHGSNKINWLSEDIKNTINNERENPTLTVAGANGKPVLSDSDRLYENLVSKNYSDVAPLPRGTNSNNFNKGTTANWCGLSNKYRRICEGGGFERGRLNKYN